MDKYTKFILTVIAVGVIGLNVYFFSDVIITPAEADNVSFVQHNKIKSIVKENNSILKVLYNR